MKKPAPDVTAAHNPHTILDLATQLCVHYGTAMQHKAASLNMPGAFKQYAWPSLSPTDKAHFKKAAAVCLEMSAPPKRYIIAQFAAYKDMKEKHRDARYSFMYTVPRPSNLYSDFARVNYIAYVASRRAAKQREIVHAPTETPTFFRDERKLQGLATALRMPATEVLARKPYEFSQPFLKHRGVWDVVKTTWLERRGM